jgi:hypothetical protein
MSFLFETGLIDMNAMSPYIEPPTIPVGMTVDRYRRVRYARSAHAGLFARLRPRRLGQ